jgi:CRP-like cAMP-binding protein
MPQAGTTRESTGNRLLAALPAREYQRLLPHLKLVALPFGDILYESGEPIRHVYFPNQGIVSLLSVVEGRSTLEVGIVGNEGMVGISIFLGARDAFNRALVQGAGMAMRMTSQAFRTQIGESGPLPALLRRYTHSLLAQISQTAVCNRFHKVEARLARWLLMTQDRIGTDELRLTQKFLSDMLGVRREGVTDAAHTLQQAKLIHYVRGRITILDRAGLEAAACQCYEKVKHEALAGSA